MAATTTRPELLLDKDALFKDLGYLPHPGQRELHRSDASRRILACGARWGKSTAASMEAVAAALAPAESSLGWVVGPSYDLAGRIFRHVCTVLQQRLPHRVIEIIPREHRLIVRNLLGGVSEVRGKSADNPVSLLGEGLDWLVVDEAARLRRDVWESFLSPRLLDRDGWALLISTPRGRDWFYKLYRSGQGGDEGFASWNFPSWENPTLDGDVIELERQRLPDEVFRVEYGGEFISDEIEVCTICGDPDGPGVVVLNEDDVLQECKACSNPVGEDGRALRGRELGNRAALRIIRLAGPEGDLLDSGTEGSMKEPHDDPRRSEGVPAPVAG